MIQRETGVLEYQNLRVNPLEQTVSYCGEEIPLTNREFLVLYLFIKYRGQVFTKKQIYEQITEDGERVDYHTIEITISKIRKKLEVCSGRKDFIITIRGRGYKFRK